ncbi:MAG: BadF/BadG/BcrA/BcrD ATPase family protein, partial [Roseiarcus sp.]
MGEGRRLYIGAYCGASRCHARLRDGEGRAIAEAQGSGGNLYVDFDAALATLDKRIDAICAKAGLAAADRAKVTLGLGLAGLSSPADAERVEARYAGFASVRAANDALAGCLGAHGGGDGALVIAGTGSAAVARVGGRETMIGGRGFLLGDDGSTARVGAEAIRAALRAHDGVGPASSLTAEVMRRFGDPLTATQWALTAKPAGYGAFMPLVFERAAAGDAVALTIVTAAARAIDALIAATRALGASHVALVGGMNPAITPYLVEASR